MTHNIGDIWLWSSVLGTVLAIHVRFENRYMSPHIALRIIRSDMPHHPAGKEVFFRIDKLEKSEWPWKKITN